MAITVKFFASLRERLGCTERQIDFSEPITVAEVWTLVGDGQPISENVLIAVNMEYAGAETVVRDGDEVAFFPPVTGGGGP
ncbi:molybdopterin converting factor, subunit 1 [Nitrosococcus halophilus Nc 4]|uniref:Molybdopterin synthase sulfur carrier subunit n=1 Tax=Nitrosococcus halophilus (strain Nc4) TaxID=472759 RepID=D5BW53_NITHN|nr:molybdopterin converting factor subunit 1 [Nitrosococcus halophilus]ADE13703.1 molybdopterin converting factor, subunit 1 [Nitrosococcus halophilus Nc 4]